VLPSASFGHRKCTSPPEEPPEEPSRVIVAAPQPLPCHHGSYGATWQANDGYQSVNTNAKRNQHSAKGYEKGAHQSLLPRARQEPPRAATLCQLRALAWPTREFFFSALCTPQAFHSRASPASNLRQGSVAAHSQAPVTRQLLLGDGRAPRVAQAQPQCRLREALAPPGPDELLAERRRQCRG